MREAKLRTSLTVGDTLIYDDTIYGPRMTKIYVTHDMGVNLAKLEKEYNAEIIRLTDKYINIVKPLAVEHLEALIESKIVDSSEEDWVLLLGFHLATVVTTKLWLRRHKKMKLLIHQRVFDKCIPLEITAE
jgi:hypothetical protein